jgi:hypothetical protein
MHVNYLKSLLRMAGIRGLSPHVDSQVTRLSAIPVVDEESLRTSVHQSGSASQHQNKVHSTQDLREAVAVS